MLKHSIKWICIFLITFVILGGDNQISKGETKETKGNPVQKEPSTQQKHKEIRWYKSFEEGLKVSKEKNKLLMVDFEAEWCIWCKRLDATTYKDSQVIKLSKKFISVKVDCDTDSITPHKYGVTGLPTIVFINSQEQVIHKVVGYRGPEDFVKEMKKALASGK